MLAGDLAARFDSAAFPALEPDAVRGIGAHDAGWAIFAAESGAAPPPLDAAGKPLCFFEIEPADFLRAWTASIDRAEDIAPVAGIIVSRHFCRLGQARLDSRPDPPAITSMLREFLAREGQRQRGLNERASRPQAELNHLTDTLQFCDLLSLYLCCGTRAAVEFPQKLGGRGVRLQWRDGACALDPSPFSAGISLGVSARRYPPDAQLQTSILPILLR